MRFSLIFIQAFFISILLTGCSDKSVDTSTSLMERRDTTRCPIINKESKAYLRGLTYGQTLSSLQEGSRQKERALIEYHSIVSMLESHGFSETAKAFAAGVHDACDNVAALQ